MTLEKYKPIILTSGNFPHRDIYVKSFNNNFYIVNDVRGLVYAPTSEIWSNDKFVVYKADGNLDFLPYSCYEVPEATITGVVHTLTFADSSSHSSENVKYQLNAYTAVNQPHTTSTISEFLVKETAHPIG